MPFEYVAWTPEMAAPAGAKANRRAYVRYQCPLATPGRLRLPSELWVRAWVLDLSISGVGLLVNRPLDAGMQIIVNLVNSVQKIIHEIPAEVRHSTNQPDGDWLVGCVFSRSLSDQELDDLLS